MKKSLIIFAILAMAVGAGAKSSDLRWDASTGQVDGYVVEWFPTDELPTESNWNTKSVGDVVIVRDIQKTFGLHPGTVYSFRVYAWNINGPSGPSNVIEYTAPEWEPPTDTVIQELDIPSMPGTLILNFNIIDPG